MVEQNENIGNGNISEVDKIDAIVKTVSKRIDLVGLHGDKNELQNLILAASDFLFGDLTSINEEQIEDATFYKILGKLNKKYKKQTEDQKDE